jgi:dolichol-phosphate mannosyltransferase
VLSVLYGAWIILRYFLYGVGVEGWTTLAVLVSFLGGLGFANLGIVGLYLGKVFDEAKNRPLYLVERILN